MKLSRYTIAFPLLMFSVFAYAQSGKAVKIHSHNDYLQEIPFHTAYDSGCQSIEVDIYLKEGELFATHTETDILPGHTLRSLYLEPLKKIYSSHHGRMHSLQLLIDLKSDAGRTLEALLACLRDYPELLASGKIAFVISGNRPPPEAYTAYPDFVKFDYQDLEPPGSQAILDKIALVSLDFHGISSWDGKGPITPGECSKAKAAITSAHSMGKPFRFWGCPDTEAAWKFFSESGVDFINTDRPAKCALYLGVADWARQQFKGITAHIADRMNPLSSPCSYLGP
jgi:alkaline phosphatase